MVAASGLPTAETESQPILDFHQHANYLGRNDQQLIAHQAYHHVTRTVLLPGDGWMLSIPVGDNETCAALVKQYPERFLLFACADVAESRTPYVLRGNIRRGALGIGELKFHVAVDSQEMHRVYKLAEELVVPVLIHFEHQTYNTGFERFESILKAYPRVNFIGHAQTWWGNIDKNHNQAEMYPKSPVTAGGLTDRLLSDYSNMYGDMSAGSGLNSMLRDEDHAPGFLKRHQDKLLFGSDCNDRQANGPNCLGAKIIAAVRRLAPDMAAERKMLYGNASKLLKISV